MKTIKIILNADGSPRDLGQNVNINQYSFQDTLLNVYVPTSISNFGISTISKEIEGVVHTYTYSTNVLVGLTYTKPNGNVYVGNGYLFTYVKKLTIENVEYALFERLLPKEFALYSGEQIMSVNVVNVESDTTPDDDDEDTATTTTTTITSVITSGNFTFEVLTSTSFTAETDETTDVERLQATVNGIIEEFDLKEDKDNPGVVSVYTDKSKTETTYNVNQALNVLNTRLGLNESETDDAKEDIQDLDSRVSILEEKTTYGTRYIGSTTSNNDPTSEALSSYVSSQGYDLTNGDVVIWIKQVVDDTDVVYHCEYGYAGWSWYAMPSVEPAKNGSLGIIKGSYTQDYVANNVRVSIQDGVVVGIYIKVNGVEEALHSAVSSIKTDVDNIKNGTINVGSAEFATYDSEEKEVTPQNRTTIANKYLTKTLGATKTWVTDNFIKNYFSTVIVPCYSLVDTKNSDELQSTFNYSSSLNVASLGTNLWIASLENAISNFSTIKLSYNNSFSFSTFISCDTDFDGTVTFGIEYDISGVNKTLVTKSQDLLITNGDVGTIKQLTFTGNLDNLIGELPAEYDSDKLVIVLSFQNNEQTARTIDLICETGYLSTFTFNIDYKTITFASGLKGEATRLDIELQSYTDANLQETYIVGEINSLIDITNNTLYQLIIDYDNVSNMDDSTMVVLYQGTLPNPDRVFVISTYTIGEIKAYGGWILAYNTIIQSQSLFVTQKLSLDSVVHKKTTFENLYTTEYTSDGKFSVKTTYNPSQGVSKYTEIKSDGENITFRYVDTSNSTDVTYNASDIGNKLDKVSTSTTYRQVYTKANNGTQAMVDATPDNGVLTIPMRDSNGRFKSATPSANEDVANKSYVDTADSGKLDKVTAVTTYSQAYIKETNGTQTIINATPDNVAIAIPIRDINGRFKVGTPSANYDVANKKYVDELVLNKIYPIGSIYMSVNNTNPATLFGGTWEQLKDRFLLGAGDTYTNGDTGGSATHTHNYKIRYTSFYDSIVSFTSGDDNIQCASYDSNNNITWNIRATDGKNVGTYKNNGIQGGSGLTDDTNISVVNGTTDYQSSLPPYLVVYMWKRTA